MSGKEKRKIAVFLLVMILLMVIFWFVLRYFGKKEAVMETGKKTTLTVATPELEETKPTGSIRLNKVTYQYFHEMETYLLIGTDNTGAEAKKHQGSMADFLLLVVLDKTTNEYRFLQLNRDTMTEIALILEDGSGEATAQLQLCTAHWYGGNDEMNCENTVKAVSKLLGGIPIDGYYAIPMEQISRMNQIVGGVTVTLEDDFSRFDSKMKQGETLKLNDEQAYLYVHNRYGVGDEENTSRMKRQKQYMKKFLMAWQEQMDENPSLADDLYREMKEYATTNISYGTVSKVMKQIMKSENRGFYEIEGTIRLGKALGDGVLHTECYLNADSLVETMKELYRLQ